jgi:hypothetical protein
MIRHSAAEGASAHCEPRCVHGRAVHHSPARHRTQRPRSVVGADGAVLLAVAVCLCAAAALAQPQSCALYGWGRNHHSQLLTLPLTVWPPAPLATPQFDPATIRQLSAGSDCSNAVLVVTNAGTCPRRHRVA